MTTDRYDRVAMRKLREDDLYQQKKLYAELEKLQKRCNAWGLKLSYSVEELPVIKRKRGYAVHKSDWLPVGCPHCYNDVRIYYLYQEIEPWRKITYYQCGRCGHEWKEIDNTYD